MLAAQDDTGTGTNPAEVSVSLRLRLCRATLFGPAVQPREAHTRTALELAKPSDNHNLPIRLRHYPADDFAGAFAGIEVRVQTAVCLQSGDAVACYAVDRSEEHT